MENNGIKIETFMKKHQNCDTCGRQFRRGDVARYADGKFYCCQCDKDVPEDELMYLVCDRDYNDGHKGWEYRLSNIKEIIEFLILTGNESDCENFLKDNGYMYDSEKNCVNPYIVLVKYAMAYRDALIDKWIENAAASGLSTETRVQLMRQFPFVQLLEQISRDIMFAGYYGENHTSDKEMKTLLKNMVNPIVSSGRWYIESYEKVTGSYEKFCNEADDWAEEWAEDSEYTDKNTNA
jgi:hypothetical protein